MPKQTEGQKETMERVLHEFKEGELETGTGKKVTSRRQAVAIGLSESGASNQQSPAENQKRRQGARAFGRGHQGGALRKGQEAGHPWPIEDEQGGAGQGGLLTKSSLETPWINPHVKRQRSTRRPGGLSGFTQVACARSH
jgi:hypothetical protein